jgi:hypothetical protein
MHSYLFQFDVDLNVNLYIFTEIQHYNLCLFILQAIDAF